jgi:hypothetical protein
MARSVRNVICSLVAAMAVVSFARADEKSTSSSGANAADPFDAPLRKIAVDAGPWPAYEPSSNLRRTLTCYYYAQVVIKEYDIGGSGAVGLSMLRSQNGESPECKPSRQRGERVIDSSEWYGYFKGVKDSLVFFDPPDDFNGDSSFAVFDSVSGKKIFDDSAYGEPVPEGYRTSRLRITSTEDGYVLKYLRVSYADCNLHAEGRACWEKIKAQTGLKSDDIPACTGYDHIAELVGTDDVESEIAYPVEVTLSPEPTVRIVGSAVRCWPQQ